MTTTNKMSAVEKRIQKRARFVARLVCAARKDGRLDEAARLVEAGQEICQRMREAGRQ